MSKTTKAVLLSVFVFPGAGHFFLKKPIHGLILISISLVALVIVINDIMSKAMTLQWILKMGLSSQIILKVPQCY